MTSPIMPESRYYFAPLEGLTGHVYRTVHHRHFPGIDRYYMPFIVPNVSGTLKKKDRADLLPENNRGLTLVPQLLSNDAGESVKMMRVLAGYGYEEVNLNLGCPMPAITRKRRGSGLLAFPDQLEAYLDGVFAGAAGLGIRVSVKTRLGMNSPEEAGRLIKIYNRYPISQLILHPRCGRNQYRGRADRAAFMRLMKACVHPLVYNGDIQSPEDVRQVCRMALQQPGSESGAPWVPAVMIGRGLLRDPSLVRQCQGGEMMDPEQLQSFHEDLYQSLGEALPRKKVLLGQMKGYWYYLGQLFDGAGKELAQIRQADSPAAYEEAVRELLTSHRMDLCKTDR